jgi:hypothetical protein
MENGTISGGAIVDASGAAGFLNAVFDDVTYEGTLDLDGGSVTVGADGLAMTGADGTGSGEVDLTAANSLLAFGGTETLDNAVVRLGSAEALHGRNPLPPTLMIGSAKAGGTLIFGPDLTVDQTGGVSGALIEGGSFGGWCGEATRALATPEGS